MIPHIVFILFLFALGACIGSFLNVVVWRLPRDQSLISPGSHCPKCNTPLTWRDNVPIFGWLTLRGRCRYCREPISPRYPIVESITGLLFAFYYVMFFILQIGPCPPQSTLIVTDTGDMIGLRPILTIQQHWPIYGLYMLLVTGLLAASLIDAELLIIPIEIPWLIAAIGVIVHAVVDRPAMPGALSVGPVGGAVALGGAAGLIISIALYQLGWIKQSFAKGEPLLEIDRENLQREIEQARRKGEEPEFHGELPPPYSRGQIRAEIGKEMLFLLPPMIGAVAAAALRMVSPSMISRDWVSGLLGAVLGALVGGFVVWLTRILGTLGFGRVAMGLGDVHLMFGAGAVVGAGAAAVAFLLAPFFGILVALYMMLTGARREMPYGPYLSLATAFVLLFYCPIADYFAPGWYGLIGILQARLGL